MRNRKSPNNDVPFKLPVLAFQATVLLVGIWFLSSSGNSNLEKETMTSLSISSTTTTTRISYKLVPVDQRDGNNNHDSSSHAYVRYAAFDASDNTTPITISMWATLLSRDTDSSASLRNDFIQLLQNAPYSAYYFETKGTSLQTYQTKQFEFVLVNAPDLMQFIKRNGPDPRAFQEHFPACSSSLYGCTFMNIGGDARLVTPIPPRSTSSLDSYSHLTTFVRNAPTTQVQSVVQIVATEYLKRLVDVAPRSVWLSTCGTGIAWLHFRLDSVPKYYSFDEFAREK